MTIEGTVVVKNHTADRYSGSITPNTWERIPNVSVTNNGGTQITSQLFGQVQVYCNKQSWNWGADGSAETPLGTGNASWPIGVHSPTYPDAYRWGVVLYQIISSADGNATVKYYQVVGTSEENLQEIRLDPNLSNLYVAVNDGVGDYGDNSGTFDINVRLTPLRPGD